MASNTQVTTGKARFSYEHIFAPASSNGGDPKYSVTLLIPKSDARTVSKIKAAMEAAKTNYLEKGTKNTLPKNLKNVIHDGDGERPNGGEYGPECKGCWVLTASSKNAPLVVDSFKNPIIDQKEIYSGCYGRAVINFYVYDNSGSKGIAAGLNGVMKLSDGEPLSGAVITDADWDDDFEDDTQTDDFGLLD